MRSGYQHWIAGFAVVATVATVNVKSVITGRVSPMDAAEAVWVLSNTDSLRSGLSSGQFAFDLKPGTYKLIVDAKDPYKDVLLDNIVVKAEETVDVGEIILKQ